MTIEIKSDVNEKIIRDRVKQWEAAWNLGSEPFSMKRFGDLYVRDLSLLAYDLTSPQTPSILRGYQQYVETWATKNLLKSVQPLPPCGLET